MTDKLTVYVPQNATGGEIEQLFAQGFRPAVFLSEFIPVLRFSSSSCEHGDSGDGESEAARPSPFVAGE